MPGNKSITKASATAIVLRTMPLVMHELTECDYDDEEGGMSFAAYCDLARRQGPIAKVLAKLSERDQEEVLEVAWRPLRKDEVDRIHRNGLTITKNSSNRWVVTDDLGGMAELMLDYARRVTFAADNTEADAGLILETLIDHPHIRRAVVDRLNERRPGAGEHVVAIMQNARAGAEVVRLASAARK